MARHPKSEAAPEGQSSDAPATTVPGGGDTGPLSPPDADLGRDAIAAYQPESVLAGRFRVVRLAGVGGMGQVFEAEDLELSEPVAIKVIRAEGDEAAVARLREEIRLARRVTHPNVCRTFDVFRHVEGGPDGPGGRQTLVVSMELLAGESLFARLRRSGRLSPAELLPIASQLTSGLAAAHAAGVVHGDFKSANVMLVPAEGANVPRVVITDFGLASRLTKVGEDSDPLEDCEVRGTPAYMAPEQLRGETVTPATDVYALGIVLFEALTGAPPFMGSSPWATAQARLERETPSTRESIPDLDPRWDEVIGRCLFRSPADRYPTADAVARALVGDDRSAEAEDPAVARARRARIIGIGLALGVITAGSTAVWLGHRATSHVARATSDGGRVAVGHTAPRRAVAFVGFRNLSGDSTVAWLSVALAEMLATDLGATDEVRVIPGENVSRMVAGLGLDTTQAFATDTLRRMRAYSACDVAVVGSFLAAGRPGARSVRLDFHVQDAASGETLASLSETGAEIEILSLVARAGERIRSTLGAREPSVAQRKAAEAAFPAHPVAARAYAEALAAMRRYDDLAARPLLEKAIALETQHPLPHMALAQVWFGLGYDQKARAEAQRALELAGHLAAGDRLWIEAWHRELELDRAGAAKAYRELWIPFPDNVEFGLRLADTLTAGGRAQEARDVVGALKRLPPPVGEDPRIDIAEADAARRLSDLGTLRAAAERAIAKGEASGARYVVARARIRLGWALMGQGRRTEALAAFRSAHASSVEAGDPMRAARIQNQIGLVEAEAGHIREARRVFADVHRVAVLHGDRRYTNVGAGNDAVLAGRQGRIAYAMSIIDPCLERWEEIGELGSYVNLATDRSSLEIDRGGFTRARKDLERSLASAREHGFRTSTVETLAGLTRLDWLAADLPSAERRLGEALRLCREIDPLGCSPMLRAAQGTLALERGDSKGGREALEDALQAALALDRGDATAAIRLALARLALVEGRSELALDYVGQAEAYYHTEEVADGEARAAALRARALVDLHRLADAQAALGPVLSPRIPYETLEARLEVPLAAAALEAATGHGDRAARLLDDARAMAARRGHTPLAFELLLARATLETGAGREGRLRAVERDARSKGLVGIADRAARLLNQAPPATPTARPLGS